MILVDGDINDMEKVLNNLIELSFLPNSIIIVGVGDAKFDKITLLDG